MSRFQLIPRQAKFFEMFRRSAGNILQGAEALVDLLANYTELERKVRRVKDIEHVGDEITHEIFNALNQSFVTPFDRDDIGNLTTALDDVLDEIEEASKRLHVYRIPEPTPLCSGFATIILDQARVIAQLVPRLEDMRDQGAIREGMVELHRLENEADDLMVEALSSLYTGVSEVSQLIAAVQWKDIYEVLEGATDRAERVGVVVETILVKNG
jgi:predicted phosphate transport protein (TIGR00153 family)